MFEFVGGFVVGVVTLIGYGAHRALKSDGWDDSNILNWLRLLSQCFIHPEDFGQMFYVDDYMVDYMLEQDWTKRPFDYINKDEFAENFPSSRPKK